MRALILRWAVILIAVFLVAWGLPQTGIFGDTQFVNYGNDWVTLAIFAAVLALLNTFIKPISPAPFDPAHVPDVRPVHDCH